MKQRKLTSGLMLLFFFLSLGIYAPAFSSDRINWHTYKEGMELGKKDRKKVFLYFYTDWCGYCRDMEKVTFRNQSVIDILNGRFIPVKVNADKEKGPASDYNVKGFPSNWFIDEKGENISALPGYIPPGKLLVILKYIHTDSYKSMTFKSYLISEANSEKKR
jgi:thioredoxin-related protein